MSIANNTENIVGKGFGDYYTNTRGMTNFFYLTK